MNPRTLKTKENSIIHGGPNRILSFFVKLCLLENKSNQTAFETIGVFIVFQNLLENFFRIVINFVHNI